MSETGEIKYGREIGYSKSTGNIKYICHQCQICGKQRWVQYRKSQPASTLCKSCAKKGSRAYQWKGGKFKDRSGYIILWLDRRDFFYPMATKKGTLPEHRLIMARHLGRCLQRWEIVHHKNGIKDDNRIENLELVASLGEHIKNHTKGYKDGYAEGLRDGRNKQIQLLKEEIQRLKLS